MNGQTCADSSDQPVSVTLIECHLLTALPADEANIFQAIHGAIARRRSLRPQLQSSTLVELWLRPTGGTSEPD
jgi:hypothetical protein